MNVTSDDKQFIIDKINKIILCFKDGYEVELNSVIEYAFDFDMAYDSFIEITNAFIDKEIFNKFKKRDGLINFIHIKTDAVNPLIGKFDGVAMIDIPCEMYTRELKTYGDTGSVGNMFVRLEGAVR